MGSSKVTTGVLGCRPETQLHSDRANLVHVHGRGREGGGEREETNIFLIERVRKTFSSHEQPVTEPSMEVDRKSVHVLVCGVCMVLGVCVVHIVHSMHAISVVSVMCLVCGLCLEHILYGI